MFDRRAATERYGIEPEPLGAYYDDDRGLFLTVSSGSKTFIQDLIQFAPDAVAFTGSSCPIPLPSLQYQRQATGDDEWIHFSVRLSGNGFEQVTGHGVKLYQPSGFCTVSLSVGKLSGFGSTVSGSILLIVFAKTDHSRMTSGTSMRSSSQSAKSSFGFGAQLMRTAMLGSRTKPACRVTFMLRPSLAYDFLQILFRPHNGSGPWRNK